MEVTIGGVKYVPADGIAMKALDTDLVACRVLKASEERRYTLGEAYPAMRADKSVAQDGHRDFVSAEVLEKTAWSWMHKGDIGMFHRAGSEGHAVPVESYIYRGPDWTLVSPVDEKAYVIKAGAWLLGTVWDDYGWQMVKAGLANGWSPEGAAKRIVADAERLAQLQG
jgi:hypothetical protein